MSEHTLLLIEDDEMIRRVFSTYLGNQGFKLTEAASAEEALKAGLGFDLIVTDGLMTGISGVEYAKILQVKAPHLPIILVTGFMNLFIDQLPSNIIGVLQKPCGPGLLATRIREALEGRPGSQHVSGRVVVEESHILRTD